MSLHITANLPQIPRDLETETFNLEAIPAPAKIFNFPPQIDVFLGCCHGCGLAVYQADNHRTEPELTCPECLAEEKSWFVPAVEVKKAA